MAVFTAMQGSRLKTAQHLYQAREELYACRSQIVWGAEEHREIDALGLRINDLLAKLIPNRATEPTPGE
jgi:hypothetical protein